MNKLKLIDDVGLRITWKLIYIGLNGRGEIPKSITRGDIIDFLSESLTEINPETDKTVELICNKDDDERFCKLIKEFADGDESDILLQKRKWVVCLLKILIDNINSDHMQGLLELTEFWMTVGADSACPIVFPEKGDGSSVTEFFTETSYIMNLNKCRDWLVREINDIKKSEGKQS